MADHDDNDDEYRVGKGKPPKGTQFKKGQSGNRKGRPQGSQNMRTVFNKEAREIVTVTEDGRTRKLRKQEIIAKKFTNDAITGSARVRRDYLIVSKQYEEPEESALTATNLSERHKPVTADIVRRILESHQANQLSAGEAPCEDNQQQQEEDEP